MSAEQLLYLLKILDIFAVGINLAPELMDSYQKSKAKIQQFVAEGRDPTPEEWQELNNQIEALQTELSS